MGDYTVEPLIHGYVYQNCGQWVPPGCYHSCNRQQCESDCVTQLPEQRIADALERIANALEKLIQRIG